jgi:DNA-binding transcriptional regulator/RsmH inhibitor MraZ
VKFKPHETYEGLRRQASSLVTIVSSLEAELSIYRKKNYELSERKLAALEKALESEKQMNDTLTRELDELRQRTNY